MNALVNRHFTEWGPLDRLIFDNEAIPGRSVPVLLTEVQIDF
jgi:hypothetical protein